MKIELDAEQFSVLMRALDDAIAYSDECMAHADYFAYRRLQDELDKQGKENEQKTPGPLQEA